MAGFDTTDVAAKVNSQPVDAIKTISGLAELNNLQNQNKMFQAKALAGQYLSAATGPDGQTDFGKLGQFLQNDKRTGPFALDLMQGAKSLTQTGTQTQQTQQAIAQAQRDALGKIAGAAYGTSPDRATRERNAYSMAAAANAQNPNLLGNPSNDQLATLIGSGDLTHALALSGAGGSGNLAAAVPGSTVIQDALGAGGQPVARTTLTNPVFGTVDQAGGNAGDVSLTQSPESAATVEQVGVGPGPGYQPRVATKGYVGQHPMTSPVAGGAPIGAEAAASAAGQASSQQAQAARQDLVASKARLLGLQNAQQALGKTTTGPGTEQFNTIKSFLNTNAPGFAAALHIDPNQIKNYDEANKYLTMYTLNRANSLGPLTGDKLAAAIAGNPNTHINQLAASDLLKVNTALERMGQAGTIAFNVSGQPEGTYSQFISNWSHSVDPRAFMLDQLTGAERSTLHKALSTVEQVQLENGYKAAIGAGVLPPAKEWHK